MDPTGEVENGEVEQGGVVEMIGDEEMDEDLL